MEPMARRITAKRMRNVFILLNAKVSGGSQPPQALHLFLRESAGSRSLGLIGVGPAKTPLRCWLRRSASQNPMPKGRLSLPQQAWAPPQAAVEFSANAAQSGW